TVMKASSCGWSTSMRARCARVNSRGDSLRALMSLDASATVRKHNSSDMAALLGSTAAHSLASDGVPCRMPMTTLKIDDARYLLTLDGERRIVAGGSILVENGRISRVGKAAELAG